MKNTIIVIESVIIVILVVVIAIGYNIYKRSQCNPQFITNMSDRDWEILMGNTDEYSKCNILYHTDSISVRDYTMYSFIFADKYKDPFAAEQLAERIFMDENLNKDTTLIKWVLPYLQYAADTLLVDGAMTTVCAAGLMSDIYNGYCNIVPVDKEKEELYRDKSIKALEYCFCK